MTRATFQLFGEIVNIIDRNVATDCVQKIGQLKVSAFIRICPGVMEPLDIVENSENSNHTTNLFTVAVVKSDFIPAVMRTRTDLYSHCTTPSNSLA